MRFFALFLRRPVGTSLLCLALVLAGALALRFLPVAPLPQVDFPMISVSASLPGASPETMASSVAMPLEQSLGAIAAGLVLEQPAGIVLRGAAIVGGGCFLTGLILIGLTGAAGRLLAKLRRKR